MSNSNHTNYNTSSSTNSSVNKGCYYMDYMLNQTAGGEDSLLLSPTIADYLPVSMNDNDQCHKQNNNGDVSDNQGVNLQQDMMYEYGDMIEEEEEFGASILVEEDEFGVGMPLNVIQEESSGSGSSVGNDAVISCDREDHVHYNGANYDCSPNPRESDKEEQEAMLNYQSNENIVDCGEEELDRTKDKHDNNNSSPKSTRDLSSKSRLSSQNLRSFRNRRRSLTIRDKKRQPSSSTNKDEVEKSLQKEGNSKELINQYDDKHMDLSDYDESKAMTGSHIEEELDNSNSANLNYDCNHVSTVGINERDPSYLKNEDDIQDQYIGSPDTKRNTSYTLLSPYNSPFQQIRSRDNRRRATIGTIDKRSSSIGTMVEQTKTPPVKDLRSAQKAVNFNSSTLVARLQAAGKQRILHLSRRRDSLAAKVQEHSQMKTSSTETTLTSIKDSPLQQPSDELEKGIKQEKKYNGVNPYKPFTARPLPEYIQPGYGGQVGVPRVEKKLPTNPTSPKLGPRRMSTHGCVQSLAMKKVRARMKKEREMKESISRRFSMPPPKRNTIPECPQLSPKSNPYKPFIARQAPMTSLDSLEYAGQHGIPKVDKREPTIPESPQITKSRKSKAVRSRDFPRSQRSRSTVELKPFQHLKSGKEVCYTRLTNRYSLNSFS